MVIRGPRESTDGALAGPAAQRICEAMNGPRDLAVLADEQVDVAVDRSRVPQFVGQVAGGVEVADPEQAAVHRCSRLRFASRDGMAGEALLAQVAADLAAVAAVGVRGGDAVVELGHGGAEVLEVGGLGVQAG